MSRINNFNKFLENNFFDKISDFFRSKSRPQRREITFTERLNDHHILVENEDPFTSKFYYIPGATIIDNKCGPDCDMSKRILIGRIFKLVNQSGKAYKLKLYAYLYPKYIPYDVMSEAEQRLKTFMRKKSPTTSSKPTTGQPRKIIYDPDRVISDEIAAQTKQPFFRLTEESNEYDKLMLKFCEFWIYSTNPGRKREAFLLSDENIKDPVLIPSMQFATK